MNFTDVNVDIKRENEKGWRGGEVRRKVNGVFGKIMQYIRYQDT